MPADERITINTLQCGGRPCVRGMRIRVSDVLDLLANVFFRGVVAKATIDEIHDLPVRDDQRDNV